MIPRQEERDIIKSGEFVEYDMGIAEGQEAWIFDILRNKTYKDKIGSPMREYIANALDEHIRHGIHDVPVEVHFPTALSNEVRIRDFAKGLCDTDVVKYFAKYGASDKRTTNALIGAFGIGCKSAFAYTDSFTINSYHKGVKTTFVMYKDETKVGKIARLSSCLTTDPSGIEIIIPVKPQDISTFVQRGLAIIKYFKTKPVIKGIANIPNMEREVSPVSGKDWKYYGDNRGSVVIQGQIGYPLDLSLMGEVHYGSTTASLPAGYIAEWEHDLLESGLEIEVPIGAVEVTASREELEMNDYTIKAIRAKLATVRDEIVDLISEKFKSAKTLVEAKTAYYNFFQKGGSYGQTLHDSVGVIKWNGIEITNNVIKLTDKHKLMQYKKKHNGDIVLTVFDKIQCHDDLNLYYDDTDRKLFMYKRRAKTLLDAGAQQVTVVQSDDTALFLSETGLDVTKLAKYSTVTPTVLASTRVAGNGVDLSKRIKHKVKVFELDWTKLKDSSVRGARSDYWKVAEIDIDKQVYVPIAKFNPNGLFDNDLRNLKNELKHLHLLGVDISKTPIYGIKDGQPTGNMIRLDAWALEQAKQIPNLAREVAIIKDYQTYNLFEFRIDEKLLADGSLAKEYSKQYAEALKLVGHAVNRWGRDPKVEARLHLADLAKLALPDEGKLIELSDKFTERYPMIDLISTHEQMDKTNIQKFVDYINLVDEGGK